ncbi:MAG: nucleotidyltransferase domain-containing protein [Cyanobium sp.]
MLPISARYTGFDPVKAAAPAASDFEALENLRRLALAGAGACTQAAGAGAGGTCGGILRNGGAAMTTTPLGTVNEALLQQMAAEIREEIPEAEVRLFGSHARGDARPDSDIELLITVPDDWLAQHNRFEVLDRLRWRLSQPRRPVDLLLFSRSQVVQRQQLHSSVVHQAYEHGWRLDA